LIALVLLELASAQEFKSFALTSSQVKLLLLAITDLAGSSEFGVQAATPTLKTGFDLYRELHLCHRRPAGQCPGELRPMLLNAVIELLDALRDRRDQLVGRDQS